MKFREEVLVFGLCLALSALAFLPGIRGQFLNFDDDRVALRPISEPLGQQGEARLAFQDNVLASLGTILDPRRSIAEVYYPVTTLSYYLDWKLWTRNQQGLRGIVREVDVLPYHLHNLLLHALVGFLLILLLLDLGLRLPIAIAASLPFLVHPALAEVVTWVASRKDLLAGVFVLLTLWRGRVALREGRALWPIWLFAVLACLSKGSALVLPLLAFLLWRPPFLRVPSASRFRILLGGLSVLCLLIALHQAILATKAGVTGIPGELLAVPGTFLHYLGTLLWPTGLAVHYPLYLREGFAQASIVKALWWALLFAGGSLLLSRGRRALPLTGLGILFFLAALLPYNNWIPGTSIAAADRYLYLAAMGLAFMLAGIFASLPSSRRLPLALSASVILTAILGSMSYRRSSAFHDSKALWTANLAVYPKDSVALTNLAQVQLASAAFMGEGREAGLQSGIDLLERAFKNARLLPHKFHAAIRLFRWLHRKGDIQKSLEWGHMALWVIDELAPGSSQALEVRIELASALLSANRLDDAEILLKETQALYPSQTEVAALQVYLLLEKGEEAKAKKRHAEIRHGQSPGFWLALVRARLLLEEGKNLAAARAVEAIKKLPGASKGENPYLTEALYLLSARPYLQNADPAGAVAELREGLALVPISVRLRLRLAPLYAGLSRYEEAESCLRLARKIRPGRELDRALAAALIGRVRGMVDKAQVEDYAKMVEEAGSLAPGLPQVQWLQGRVLWGRKDRAGALKLVRRAHKAAPRDKQIQRDYLTLLKATGYDYLLRKREDQAIRVFQELLANTPPSQKEEEKFIEDLLQQHFDRRRKAGGQALEAERFEEAIKLYESALQILPEDVGARFNLGIACFVKAKPGSQDLKRAEESFRRALHNAEKLERDPARMVLYLSYTLIRQKRKPEARELLELYLEGVKKSLIKNPSLKVRMRKQLKAIAE